VTIAVTPTLARGGALIALCLALAACEPSRPAPERRDDGQRQAAEAEERKAIAGIETDVRIKSLQAQVDQLQAQLSEIRDGKDALDTRLLAERVSSLEQRVYAGDPPAPKATATPTSTPTPRPRPKLELKLPPPER
jgi:hypothetical protein